MARAAASGRRLTPADASIIKGMIARGDRHHDIAAWFGVNQGRIAEVNGEAVYADVPIAPAQSFRLPDRIHRDGLRTGRYLPSKVLSQRWIKLRQPLTTLSRRSIAGGYKPKLS